ncbi:FGGY-family carbohydrate kinase, partial [Oenococcus oeni]
QLTKEGSLLIDPSGDLQDGSVFCPPEGDAGTGMVATNSVNQRSGNVSAGTSIFSMVVLEHPLKKVYPEVDVVSTPTGDDVAMIHANNATSDINAWMHLFEEFLVLAGKKLDKETVFRSLFFSALTDADADAGNLLT